MIRWNSKLLGKKSLNNFKKPEIKNDQNIPIKYFTTHSNAIPNQYERKKEFIRSSSVGSRCCSLCSNISKNVKNNKCILLIAHLGLFVLLASYIIVGGVLIIQIDEGTRRIFRNKAAERNFFNLTSESADQILNLSLSTILEKSRDAVLDTIFMSDEMQAALTVYKVSRLNILPADRKLELLSEKVLENWKVNIEEILSKLYFITIMEERGHEISYESKRLIWNYKRKLMLSNNSEASQFPMQQWNLWTASVRAFTILTTMGSMKIDGSLEGRIFIVVYCTFGAIIYAYVIIVWSQRLKDLVVRITNNKSNISSVQVSPTATYFGSLHSVGSKNEYEGIMYARDMSKNNDQSPHWLLVFATIPAVILYVLLIGPLACGSTNLSFDENFELGYFAIMLMKAPPVLSMSNIKCLGLFFYIIFGHIIIFATFRLIKKKVL